MERNKKIQKPKRKSVDTSILNSDQRFAFGKLASFIQNPDCRDIYVLKGWAGTGKTFCVSLLVKYVLEELYSTKKWYKIAVTGPTNKSVRVLRKTSGIRHPQVSFVTIHKLLGLKEKITLDGRQEFVNDTGVSSGINQTKLLIIDEVSMLNDDLFEEIINHRHRVKIICMGDPAQIPPVGRPDCIPFRDELSDKYGIETIQLKTIMRQKVGNPIIDASIRIRENLASHSSPVQPVTVLNEKGEGIEFLNLHERETRRGFSDIVSRYYNSDRFKSDPDYVKIIAWRNKTVATMNSVVRKSIYGEDSLNSKILVGERLIANNPIIFSGIIQFNTNDEFTVESYNILSENVKGEFGSFDIKYYETKVSYLDDNDDICYDTIDILHEDSEPDFSKIAAHLKATAIRKEGKEKSWIAYYDFLRKYADVSYAYAITAHKSQGSTYEVAFISEDDIDLNYQTVEKNRIKYTAYTRASKKLYILKKF